MMAMTKFAGLSWLVLVGVGCTPVGNSVGKGEMWVGDAIRRASIDRAIVAQRTLYPYHFVTDAAELNDLGRRDLRALAKHYREHTGELALWRGDASETLYEARQTTVEEQLLEMGISAEQLIVGDGVPGGDGISSERLIRILSEQEASASVQSSLPIRGTQ